MIRINLTLKAVSPIALPAYAGSALRGGFGHAFKKVACTVRDKTCDVCILKSSCIYSYVFETPPPHDSEILRKYEKAPHPFVIEPPLEDKRTYDTGETFAFGLILLGKATDHLPYFILAFDELGRMGIGKGRGRYELAVVSSGNRVIYEGKGKILKNDFKPTALKDALGAKYQDAREAAVDFLTPTRIVVNEDLVVDLEFHHLVRSLLRRISTISYFHYGERLDIDFKGLIERAGRVETVKRELRWHDWERYSARQDTRMKLGGFVGQAVFCGELAEFMPFLKVGEMLHAGKGTSFGLGKYRMEA